MQFFEYIRTKYTVELCTVLKMYSRQVEKLAKITERSKYLQSCRKAQITPRHIKNSTQNINQLVLTTGGKAEINKIKITLHKKLLNVEISESHINIKNLKKEIKKNEENIKDALSEMDFIKFKNQQWEKFYNIKEKVRKTHTSKLNKLKLEKFKELNLIFNEEWFINNTNVEFDIEMKWLLSLGSKFAIPVNKHNFAPIPLIADMEQWIQNIDDETEKEATRTKIANQVYNFKKNLKNTEKEKYIISIYEKTRSFLEKYKNEILVTNADKGNKTVIMYISDYKRKMNELLADKKTYKHIKEDPTEKLQRANNNIITKLQKQNIITKYEKIKMISHTSAAPELYGLPKIHKEHIPLRPISSSRKVPCYELAKHIGKILKSLISPIYNIKNSMDLKNKLQDIKLDDDDILVSFDVVSLFTNIPIYLAIKNILDKWTTLAGITKISRKQFLQLLQFCVTKNNYFTFDEKIYLQMNGMPMGNPLSPTIADIVLDTLLDDVITELRLKNIHIKCLTKYVDDIFAIIKKSDEKIILETLNNYHNKIKFTIEKEQNGKIAYLDMLIIKNNKKLITDWYTKPTSSGRIINFHSTQPFHTKFNTAANLIEKVLHISDEKFRNNNMNKTKHILLKNNFPIPIITNIINKTLNKHKKEKLAEGTGETKFYSVPFIPKLTELNTLKNTFCKKKTKTTTIAYKSNKTLRHIFTSNRKKADKLMMDNVVYEIKCAGNEREKCDMVYIGTTKRMLGTRIKEHKSDVKNNKETTGLAQHVKDNKHNMNFDDVKILNREESENKRFTIESLRIQQKINTTMNKKEDKDNTKLQYSIAII